MVRTLKEYPSIALNLEDLTGKIKFQQVFGRSGPINVEIGTGKATFLIDQAKAQPHVNFLGIERANKYYRYAIDRIGRWALTNVRMIRTDADSFLADFIPDNSVDCFHIYFPDPWPKRRHHKRRFLCTSNIKQLLRCLKTGGAIRIATDYADYFQQIRKLIDDEKKRLEEIKFTPTAGAQSGELTGTNYERKYLKEKRQMWTLAIRKKQHSLKFQCSKTNHGN